MDYSGGRRTGVIYKAAPSRPQKRLYEIILGAAKARFLAPAERAAAKQAQCTVSKCNRQALLEEAGATHMTRAPRDTLALIREIARTVPDYGTQPTPLPSLLASGSGCRDAAE
ncbi:hypothetical protein NDU88_010187 [Pleurodeles waltl]|uniref:Uncharacterized protein n=1 Tax=Pleurodeles waltl TaxID=8319 RepID=A0AAV7Q1G4_PLEWA|nr:hypothetical protein NDU88_010187 [Pleurodeles waltl]